MVGPGSGMQIKQKNRLYYCMEIKQEALCIGSHSVAGLAWLSGRAPHSPRMKHALCIFATMDGRACLRGVQRLTRVRVKCNMDLIPSHSISEAAETQVRCPTVSTTRAMRKWSDRRTDMLVTASEFASIDSIGVFPRRVAARVPRRISRRLRVPSIPSPPVTN